MRKAAYQVSGDPFLWYMIILVIYSLIPYSLSTYLQIKILGLPLSYIPFLIVSLVICLRARFRIYTLSVHWKYLFFVLIGLMLFIVYSMFQPFNIRILAGKDIDFYSHYSEVALYTMYAVIVFIPTLTILLKKGFTWLIISSKNCLNLFFVVVIIAIPRYFLFDRETSLFFNLFNPLQYRLIEVLFLMYFACISVALFQIEKQNRYILIHGVLAIAILIVGSRTGYLGYLLFIILNIGYMILYMIRNKIRIRWKSGKIFFRFSIAVVAVLTIILNVSFNTTVQFQLSRLTHIATIVSFDLIQVSEAQHSLRRFIMLISSFELFVSNLFTGIGLGSDNFISNFPAKYLVYTNPAKPHNFYLYVLAAQGIFGAFPILFFISGLLGQVHSLKRVIFKTDDKSIFTLYHWIFGCIIICCFFIAQFESQPFIWLFLSVNVFLYSDK